jgi:hypothetical protein
MIKPFNFNESDAIVVATNMLKRFQNIHKDNKGHFFYGGTRDNDIECPYNKDILEDNESRLRKTFKNHSNWSNMRKSQKPVGNHLRFIFCKLTNQKSYGGTLVRFGNYTCRKYYIPDCISVNLEDICILST